MMRLPDKESVFWDVLLAVALGGIAIAALATMGDGPREGPLAVNLALAVVYGGLGGLRRRAPIVACYGFVGVLLVYSAFLTPPPEMLSMFLGLLVFPYSAGYLIRGPVSLAYVPVVLLGVTAANLADPGSDPGDWIFPPVMTIVAYFGGRNVVHRALLAAELHEAGLRAEEDRLDETRRAVADERRRIAREMHDVVAHSISMMVVQAGGARRIIERDPARAAQAAELIEKTGRETLEEMRCLLGVMRDPATPAERVPNPTLADLGLLSRGGLHVDVSVVGEPRPVSAGLELGAFRVLEETLGALREAAPDARAEVTVTWAPDLLTLTVTDDRPSRRATPPQVLPAVRERVALYGGTIDLGEHRMDVRFPLQDQDPTQPVPAQGAA